MVSRFLFVGAAATALQYLVYGALLQMAPWPAAVASVLGYGAGSVLSYLLNYHVTFESNIAHGAVMPKFYLIATVGFLLNVLIMWQMVHHFEIHYVVSQFVATGVVLVWGFAGNSIWTFHRTR